MEISKESIAEEFAAGSFPSLLLSGLATVKQETVIEGEGRFRLEHAD